MKITNHLMTGTVALALCAGAISTLSTASTARADDTAAPKADAGKTTADYLSDFKKTAEAAADPQVKSLGTELGSKLGALNTSLDGNSAAQSQLQTAVAGLAGQSGPVKTLNSLQQLSAAKLTPEQTKLAKDVYNTGSAYLLQKNLGAVEGAQGDVATAVSALKKGSPIEALPALKNIGQNAKLTDTQKVLVQTLAKSYVPGLQKADDLLKNIPGLSQ